MPTPHIDKRQDREQRFSTKRVLAENSLGLDSVYANNSLRTVHIVFASLFSSILTPTWDSDGKITGSRVIPLRCTTRDALGIWLDNRFRQDTGKTQINRLFPILSYEMTSMMPDTSFQTSPQAYRARGAYDETSSELFGRRIATPVAYRFGFNLGVYTNSMQNGLFILDQILPYFAPEVQISIKENKELNIRNDVKIVLSEINHDDNYQDVFERNRIISWTLRFNLYAHIAPSPRTANLIKKVVVSMENQVNQNLESYITSGKQFPDQEDVDYEHIDGDWIAPTSEDTTQTTDQESEESMEENNKRVDYGKFLNPDEESIVTLCAPYYPPKEPTTCERIAQNDCNTNGSSGCSCGKK